MLHARIRRRPVPAAWALLVVGLLIAWRLLRAEDDPPSPDPGSTHRVAAVEHGDTLVLESGQRVGLIGVRPLPAARDSDWLESAVAGRTIRLEFDRHRIGADGVLLANVFTGDTFINAEFVRSGLGRLDTSVSLRSDRERMLRDALP
jgi:endonuclease YncB( thermonuclease family)